MKKTIHIVASTTSPMHTAYPDGATKLPDGSLVQLTHKKGVGNINTPCHPANGFRGALRRHAADRIMDVLADRGEKVSAEVYNGLRCGAATAQPDTASNSIEEMVRAGTHVYMGLFGGAARLLRSRYSVQDLDIICQHNVDAGTVSTPPAMIEELLTNQTIKIEGEVVAKAPYHYLERSFFTRVDDIGRGVKSNHIENVIDGGFEGVQSHAAETIDSNAKRKADSTVKKTSVSHLVSIERIKAGTPVALRIDIDADATDAQVGMILQSLQDMFTVNRIGGYGRNGYGRLRVEGVQFNNEGDVLSQSDDFYQDDMFSFNDDFSHFIDAANDEITGIDTEELVSYFTNLGK